MKPVGFFKTFIRADYHSGYAWFPVQSAYIASKTICSFSIFSSLTHNFILIVSAIKSGKPETLNLIDVVHSFTPVNQFLTKFCIPSHPSLNPHPSRPFCIHYINFHFSTYTPQTGRTQSPLA